MVRILSIVFIPLIYFYGVNFIQLFSELDVTNSLHFNFLVGIAVAAIFFRIILRRISFLTTFEHELTHNIWAVLTFNKPIGFHVEKDNGGYFQYSGSGNFLITLSPYFFQTFNMFLFLIIVFIQVKYYPLFLVLIGVAAGYHFISDISEASPRQPDLRVYGLFFSYVVILLGNVIMYGLVFSFIIGHWQGMYEFLIGGVRDMYLFIVQILSMIL